MARVGKVPSLRDGVDQAIECLRPLLRPQSLEYVERRDDLYVEEDYALYVKKSIKLRCVDGPLHCLETGWTSHDVPAMAEHVGFRVDARSPYQAFGLLMDDRPTDKNVLVMLVPSLPKKKTLTLTIEWWWPDWWRSLREHGKDRVLVHLPSSANALAVSVNCHVKVCKAKGGSPTLSTNPPEGDIKRTASGSYVRDLWKLKRPRDGTYEIHYAFSES